MFTTMCKKDRQIFELMLIIVAIGLTYMFYRMGGFKMVALNLFFLPIVLSGYYLGRTSAGVLAVLCALAVMIVTTFDTSGFAAYNSPLTVGLALTVWAAVLGLTAILVGTLCDERAKQAQELHVAYVGVVEVLSKYLQSGDPKNKARSTRIAEMCQTVGEEMRLSRKQVDDIRVGALLYSLGNVEITTKLITKAVNTLESTPHTGDRHTFLGTDLAHSLGSVLQDAVPLLMNQDDGVSDSMSGVREHQGDAGEVPLGARVIRAVRAFDALTVDAFGEEARPVEEVLQELRKERSDEFGMDVLDAVERVTRKTSSTKTAPQPALVP